MKLKLTIEYDGTDFHGWAAQPGLRTVEGELRRVLAQAFGAFDELAVAGRTDTGVHALGQVASVTVSGGPPAEHAAEALNALLAPDVAVVGAEAVSPGFHARHSARARTYRYRIWRRRTPSAFEQRRSWWVPRPLDDDALAAVPLFSRLARLRGYTTQIRALDLPDSAAQPDWLRGLRRKLETRAAAYASSVTHEPASGAARLGVGR